MRAGAHNPSLRIASTLLALAGALSACARADESEVDLVETDGSAAPVADTGAPSAVDASPSVDIHVPGTAQSDAGGPDASATRASLDAGPAVVDAAPHAERDAGAACVRGAIEARQVVMIGDSFFHITEIPQALWSNAREAGSLGPDETYRHYYLSGAMVAAEGLVAPIPTQWDDALAEDPDIRVVIFNGGGNDVLIGDRSCLTQAPPQNAGCATTIENVRKTVRALMDRMAQGGVQQVVYATYPHMPTWGLFQGDAPAINEMIDYAEEISRRECEASKAPSCVFVSTKAAFEGHPEYLNALDVHASPEGSKVAGALIWDAMVDHCIAQ